MNEKLQKRLKDVVEIIISKNMKEQKIEAIDMQQGRPEKKRKKNGMEIAFYKKSLLHLKLLVERNRYL